ncbi:hypothetical protein BDR26DRAFT_580087 [Obelidium mucronatum]|nr:hypothetical protein BDR26DRAFT_580087 [Obelidium mucronatum]
MRKSVSFDNTVVVGHTFDAASYDRSTQPPSPLSAGDIFELKELRVQMVQITAFLTQKRNSIERELKRKSFMPIAPPLHRVTSHDASTLISRYGTSPPRQTTHQPQEAWTRRRPTDLRVDPLTAMTRNVIVGSPTRSGGYLGDMPPYLSSAPSSPSADSVSSVASAFWDNSTTSAHTIDNDVVDVLGSIYDDASEAPPLPAKPRREFGAIGTRPRATSTEEAHAAGGSLYFSASADSSNHSLDESEYSQFGGSKGFLHSFYKSQGWVKEESPPNSRIASTNRGVSISRGGLHRF